MDVPRVSMWAKVFVMSVAWSESEVCRSSMYRFTMWMFCVGLGGV